MKSFKVITVCGAGVGTEKNRGTERKIGENESRCGDDAL